MKNLLVILILTVSNVSFAQTKDVSVGELFHAVLANTNPSTGILSGKLLDLGGDCFFAISRNPVTQAISLTIETTGKSPLLLTLDQGEKIVGLTKRNEQDGTRTELFISAKGSLSILVAQSYLSVSLSNGRTELTCSDQGLIGP